MITKCRRIGAVVTFKFGKGKVVPVYAMKAYKGSGCLAPLILNPGTRIMSGQLNASAALLLGNNNGSHE
jgi:hypothetical protein